MTARFVAALCLLGATPFVHAQEPAVTVVADFEEDSVAPSVGETKGVSAADCSARRTRGLARNSQWRLETVIGATEPGASMVCDLQFRAASRFNSLERVAIWCWLQEGEVDVAFRLRDGGGSIFETDSVTQTAFRAWKRIVVDFEPKSLRRVSGPSDAASGPVMPLEVAGLRIVAKQRGRQEALFDDIEIEHRAAPHELVAAEFVFDQQTRIYEPGALISAWVRLENLSREKQMQVSVELDWLDSRGQRLNREQKTIALPHSGDRFRSEQRLDFSQRIERPGIYQLVATVQSPGWKTARVARSTVAVTPSNRTMPRGRSTFFGVRANLLREPLGDQELEIAIAREIGAQLLLIEVPWRRIEPAPDKFDLAELNTLVRHAVSLDMAVGLALTEPPGWLTGMNAAERQTLVVKRLSQEFGERLSVIQPTALVDSAAELVGAARELQSGLQSGKASIEVFTPPIDLKAAQGAVDALKSVPPAGPPALVLRTEGWPRMAARRALDFGRETGLAWSPSRRWQYDAPASDSIGALSDAVEVFQMFVDAARAGVGGVTWFDLRDDSADPRDLSGMRGLVRRDFSPKVALLGYANTVGMLSGLVYSGALRGADAASFDSSIFIGGGLQVAVLEPLPNRVPQAFVAPAHNVQGEMDALDFERRPVTALSGDWPALVPTSNLPQFVTLRTERAQDQPEIWLNPPWLRLPAKVLCGTSGDLHVELDLPRRVGGGYVQLEIPSGAPAKSTFSAASLSGSAGESQVFDIPLTLSAADFQPFDVFIVLKLDKDTLRQAVKVCPLGEIRPTAAAARVSEAQHMSGRLATEGGRDVPLHLGYQKKTLYAVIPLTEVGNEASVHLGIAVENANEHIEATIDDLKAPKAVPSSGFGPERLAGWRVRVMEAEGDKPRLLRVEIPASSLGAEEFAAGQRLLLAVRIRSGESVWLFGRGLDGDRRTDEYRWMRLAAE